MTLGVCMIVRDEAPRLEAAIASVQSLADEIVVLDTGSTDGTPELAAALGARVARFAWNESFAAARNASLELVRAPWALLLDADQRLESPAALPEPLEGDAYRVRIVDSGVESWRIALVRSHLRMVGRIHEGFDPLPNAPESALRLRHEGYRDGSSKVKHRRNLPLLDLELAERPHRLDVRIERARTRAALGDPSLIPDALARIDFARPPVAGYVAMLLEAALLRPAAERPAWVEPYAARWFPDSLPLLWTLARLAAGREDLDAARRLLERLVALAKGGGYDRSVAFGPALLGDRPRLQLAAVLARMGRLDEAETLFAALVRSPEVGEDARANLEIVRRTRGSLL